MLRFFVVLVTSAVLCLVIAVPAQPGFGDSVGLADGGITKGKGIAIGEKSEPDLSRAHAPGARAAAADIPVNRPEYSHNGERGTDRSKLK
jgi:hypothetical protein